MSAYLCSAAHLSAVAEICKIYVDQNIVPEDLFRRLLRVNIQSLNARYTVAGTKDWRREANRMNYLSQNQDNPGARFSTVMRAQHLKALRCYCYQSCEHKAYYNSFIGELLEKAVANCAKIIAMSIKEYDAAEWGW